MKRYPAYKDSGVEWLGEVPEGWVVVQARHLVHCLDGQRVPLNASERADVPGEIPYWGANGVVDTVATALFNEPLVLLGEDGAPFFDKSKPVAFFSKGPIWPNNHIHVLRARNSVLSEFLTYAFNAVEYGDYVDGSTRDKLTQAQLMSIVLPLPPLPEQQAIAGFLDREVGKIDALVEEQRRLIALLAEKRQAVISHAVTKGLNPAAPLKPSGTDWLGDIPEGWEYLRLSIVCNFEQGKAHEPYFDDDGKYICVTARFVSSSGEHAKRCSANLTPATGGDILMVMSDLPDARALARSFLVDEDDVYAVNQRVCKISVLAGDPRFFSYQLNRHPDLLAENDGFNQTHLSNGSFTKLKLLVPPLDEQVKIADYLEGTLRRFDSLTAVATSAITLLQERRAALISAAVTGKIDVRDISSQSIPEPEPA